MAATVSRHVGAMRVLLRAPGIDPNIKERRGMTAFHLAIRSWSNAVVAEIVACPAVNWSLQDNAKVGFEFRNLQWIMSTSTNCSHYTRVCIDKQLQVFMFLLSRRELSDRNHCLVSRSLSHPWKPIASQAPSARPIASWLRSSMIARSNNGRPSAGRIRWNAGGLRAEHSLNNGELHRTPGLQI
jgi:hypothetical protein